MHMCLHEKGKAKAVEKVGGGGIMWSASHMARPAGHHLASYQLNQVGNPSLDLHKYPLPVEIRTHTIFWRFHLQSSHS
jgi:hypothetical protein